MVNLATGIRVETWEGFNHVACIIIASAMAGIGLITDSLSVVEGDAMMWVAEDHPNIFFFVGGSFGRSFQIIELESPKFSENNVKWWHVGSQLFDWTANLFHVVYDDGWALWTCWLASCSLSFDVKRPSKEKQHQTSAWLTLIGVLHEAPLSFFENKRLATKDRHLWVEPWMSH